MLTAKDTALLVTCDGDVFSGESLGAMGETSGEVVFNTSLSGYQEILTDPSYKGQIVLMTNPLIGNYGVTEEDEESRGIFLEGFIVKEASPVVSNWRAEKSLDDYLKENGIVSIQGIDTRALTKKIRKSGAMPAIISSTKDVDIDDLKKRAAALAGTDGIDMVAKVTTDKKYEWNEGLWDIEKGFAGGSDKAPLNLIAIDFGVKRNILRSLVSLGAKVTVVPASTSADEILAMEPDGLFLSNGPGDPSAVPYASETIKALIGKIPIFGICLGHQLLSLALGATTYKLPFGHHGGNHPVKDLATDKVEITSQNHNYAVDEKSLPEGVVKTHANLYDGTLEGISDTANRIFSVQYHPEAAPGPHDSAYLFERFKSMVMEAKSKNV